MEQLQLFDILDDSPAKVTPKLDTYDRIIINSSAGKDSAAMLHQMVADADAQGVSRSKLLVVHCDLGKVEWKGVRELAEKQADHYGIEFLAVSRPKTDAPGSGDLLDQVRHRGMWPNAQCRYCTSEHKRGQVLKVHTGISQALRDEGKKHVRILNCLGFRADESPARKNCPTCGGKGITTMEDKKPTKKSTGRTKPCHRCDGTGDRPTYERNKVASCGYRTVNDWLPIHEWNVDQVWEAVRASGLPRHEAYDLGMPRLSCVFCIFAPEDALHLAGEHNPELLDEYVQVELDINHTFKNNLSLKDIRDSIRAGHRSSVNPNTKWNM